MVTVHAKRKKARFLTHPDHFSGILRGANDATRSQMNQAAIRGIISDLAN